MDGNDRRQRQSNPTGFPAQPGLVQGSPQYVAASTSSDRYRQPQVAGQSTSAAPSGSRNNVPSYGYQYGDASQFASSAMHGGAPIQYPAEYAQTEQRGQQGYQQYGGSMAGMYNVQQQNPTGQQSSYEPVQPYQSRSSTGMDVLAHPYGVGPYYDAPTSNPSGNMQAPNVPSQYSNIHYVPQSPPIGSSYESAEPAQGSTSQQYSYQAQSASQQAELESQFASYQSELRRTFEYVRDSRIAEAGPVVIRISEWLLSTVEALGFVRDEEELREERLGVWLEFNYSWLATLQAQKDLTLEILDTGQQLQPPASMLDADGLEAMGKKLMQLCDNLEKHGLVDYEMGVWEEEIINLLIQCLDLVAMQRAAQPPPTAGSSSGTQQASGSGSGQQQQRRR